MRLLATSFLVLLLSAIPTVPQSTPPLGTFGLENGRLWALMTNNEKSAWVSGYENGFSFVLASVAVSAEATNADNLKMLARNFPNLTVVEVVSAINHFYVDTPENAAVPVAGAMRVVALKSRGASQSEIDDLVASLRKNAASGR
jgi:hypothetical protein